MGTQHFMSAPARLREIEPLRFRGQPLGSGPITLTSGATLTINPNGNFTYNSATSATLAALILGAETTDGFTYRVEDGHGGAALATVLVTVQGLQVSVIDNEKEHGDTALP